MIGGGCSKPAQSPSNPPQDEGGGSGGGGSARPSDPNCPAGGPSVSVNVSRESGDRSLSGEQLGALLGWIGGFAQPCIEEPSQAPHITMVFVLGEEGEAPTFEFVEREQLPTMAACLDEGFAAAPAPPPDPMRVSIVVPWGCPTLGPGFQPSGASPEAAEPEPGTSPAPASP
jgi:hypothetical protein